MNDSVSVGTINTPSRYFPLGGLQGNPQSMVIPDTPSLTVNRWPFDPHPGILRSTTKRQTRRSAPESSPSRDPEGEGPADLPRAATVDRIDEHKWDIFISHASEDKDDLVRPLATILSRLGLRVWYDEFSLRVGDSLSQSIDKGLADADYGLVVLSPAFFAKPWPKRELAGLVALTTQPGKEGRILPIWHRVAAQDVLAFSPTLADVQALIADEEPTELLALRILSVVKPSAAQAVGRRTAFALAAASAEPQLTQLDRLKPGPLRHRTLPQSLRVRIALVNEIFQPVFRRTYEDALRDFSRDIYPDMDVQRWEAMAVVFSRLGRGLDTTGQNELYRVLLLGSMDMTTEDKPGTLTDSLRRRALNELAQLLGPSTPARQGRSS